MDLPSKTAQMSEPIIQPKSDTAARMLGLGFLTAGAAMIYWQGVLPLLGAIREEPWVGYSIKLIIIGEFFVAAGLYWIIRGLAGYEAVRSIKDNPAAKKKLIIASLVATLLSWWLLDQVFKSYGYISPSRANSL
jgi:hypothetical protein